MKARQAKEGPRAPRAPIHLPAFTRPLLTRQDVLDRVTDLLPHVLPPGEPGPVLWPLYLRADSTQASVIPVLSLNGVPRHLLPVIAHAIFNAAAEAAPGGSLVFTLSRPGPAAPSPADLPLLRALRERARARRTRVRMICLATPAGTLDLRPQQAPRGPEAGP